MNAQFWLWLDTIAMLVGGLVILAIGKRRNGHEQAHTIYHGVVPIIAACSYFAMAVDQGSVTLPLGAPDGTGRLFYYARYIDWTFTTPLLLLSLSYTAMHSSLRRGGMVAGLLLADVIMILTALFFGLSEVAWIKWTWFLVSCVAFLAVYYVIWVPLAEQNRAESAEVQSIFRRNASILTVVWLIYPLILAVSPDGLGVISSALGVALIAIVDLIAKVVYGLMSTMSNSKLVDKEEAAPVSRVSQRMAA